MKTKPPFFAARSVIVLALALLPSGCTSEPLTPPETFELRETSFPFDLPFGLPNVPVPEDNPITAEKVAIGKRLFFDKRLSSDYSISCATCHDPEKGWSNAEPFATGVGGAVGGRHVPSILNVGYYKSQFWDGRASTLEEQALGPILNPIEMAMPSEESIVERLSDDAEYRKLFGEAFADGLTVGNVAKAIASFERTILMGNTAYDHYENGNKNAMSESAIRGMKVFLSERRGNCGSCHVAPLFTDHKFYNIGVGMDQPNPDLGYQTVSKLKMYRGAFKSPSLRGVAQTAPYMHDGSLKTLMDVVEYYDKGGISNSHLNAGVHRLRLSDQEKKDLVEFMELGLGEYPTSNSNDS